jgi:hypothetical protein
MNANTMEMFVYQWFADVDKFYNTIIRIYGIKKSINEGDVQKNICLKVINFKPYCFVQIPDNLYENVCIIKEYIKW